MNIIVVGSAWLLGIYLGSLLQLPPELGLLGVLLFGGLAAIWWPLRCLRLASIFSLVLLLGVLRFGVDLRSPATPALSPGSISSPVRIIGMVSAEPEMRDRRTHLVVEVEQVMKDGWEAASGKVIARLARFPEYRYGDVLELTGQLKEPRSFEDFDYRAYLAQRGIAGVMDYPVAKRIDSDTGNAVLGWIYDLREALTDALDRSLPEPQSSLAAGVFLGIRTTIPDDLLDAFSRTNTYHILAISGMNITLVCGLLGSVGRRVLGRRLNMAFLLVGIAAYVALVGPQPSVVRASIMGALLVVGSYFGRPADTIAWLLLAAGLMTAYNPSMLADVGFQLSFMATAGLALLVPVFQPYMARLPRWLGETLAITFAAQIATAPITALNFGQFSVVTPVANLLVVPAVLPLIIGAALTAALGLAFEPAGHLFGWVTYLIAAYVVAVVEALGSIPWSSLSLGKFGVLPVLLFYGVLALVLTGRYNRVLGLRISWLDLSSRLPMSWTFGTLGIAAVVVWAGALTVPGDRNSVSFLDVGQGDAALIQTSSGRRVLVDGGPSPSTVANLLGRRLPFWDRAIDLVVLTHANEDHLAGLLEVIERHDVKLVLEPAIPHTSANYVRWLEIIRRKNIAAVPAIAGQEVVLDDRSRLLVLHPGGQRKAGTIVDLNEHSVVLKLITGSVSVLLTGDAGPEAQRQMLASGQDLAATVLKVPHHGASSALNPDFLAAVRPRVAVISVGASNRFGHPATDTLRRLEGINLYRTDLDGTVEIHLEPSGYSVRTSK